AAVTTVIMSPSLGLALLHGQQGLRAVEGLDLAFLVDAEHDRSVRRVHIQADDIPNLLDEERVVGEFERLRAVGFQPEGPPDPTDAGLRHTGAFGHPPSAPVSGVLGLGLERLGDDLLDVLIGDLAWSPGPLLIRQSIDSSLKKSPAPFANGLGGDTELGCDLLVVHTTGAGQDDFGSLGQLLGSLGSGGAGLQESNLVVGK